MAQEFTINSEAIESKINSLLPSQGGFGAGIDFSASTMIIPTIDLTETASGSSLRVDLQSAFSHAGITAFNVSNATTTIVSTTGYWRLHGILSMSMSPAGTSLAQIQINDGFSTKTCWGSQSGYGSNPATVINTIDFDFIVFLGAGDSLILKSDSANSRFLGSTRQIATVDGTLVNPT